MDGALELWKNGPRVLQRKDVFPLGMDAVLLADFSVEGGGRKVCDLGCGCGIISLLLALNLPEADITAVDISPTAAELSAENVRINGLSGHIDVKCADVRKIDEVLPTKAYDLIVSNPPYFQIGRGIPKLKDARSEEGMGLTELCSAAEYLVKANGRLALVYRPERISEVITTMKDFGFEPKRMRFVHHSAGHPAALALVEGRQGGKKAGLKLLPPILIYGPDGKHTDEFCRIYKL